MPRLRDIWPDYDAESGGASPWRTVSEHTAESIEHARRYPEMPEQVL